MSRAEPEAVAAIDVGSSALKGVMLSRSGEVLAEGEVPLGTQRPEAGQVEQQPDDWWRTLRTLLHGWQAGGVNLASLQALSFSGQMQDVILTRQGAPTGPALLYADTRAEREVAEVGEVLGLDPALISGNPFTAASVPPKLLWLQRHFPERLTGRPRLHVGAKDVLIERLCGAHVTDHTTAATTGLYDLAGSRWLDGWLPALGLDVQVPELRWPHEVAGYVHAEATAELGLPPGLPVLCGIGDAGATTLGAGSAQPGERHIYLGTSGFLGAVVPSTAATADAGLFRLPLLSADARLSVAPLTNAGSVWRWAAGTFAGADDTELERLVSKARPAALLCLPYLAGERSPIKDPQARGVFLGVGPESGPGELARSALEGVAYALRATAEQLGGPLSSDADSGPISLLGGGSRSPTWCQIIADVLGHDLVVPQRASLLPVLGSASAAFRFLGWSESFGAYRREVLGAQPAAIYRADVKQTERHTAQFARFQQLYPAVRELF